MPSSGGDLPARSAGPDVQPTPAAAAALPGLHGPALWIAVGVLIGASLSGILFSYFRQTSVGVVTVAAAPSSASPGPSASPIARRIDLNIATQTELEMLPGVGPTMALRIIEYRTTRGAFKSVEELDRVKGVGPRMIEQLRGLVQTGRAQRP